MTTPPQARGRWLHDQGTFGAPGSAKRSRRYRVRVNDFSDDDTRRLLGYLGVALVAGGATVTDAEADVKLVGRHLGYPNVQVSALPTTVMLSLTSGGPASIERNEGPFRLDQSYAAAECASS